VTTKHLKRFDDLVRYVNVGLCNGFVIPPLEWDIPHEMCSHEFGDEKFADPVGLMNARWEAGAVQV